MKGHSKRQIDIPGAVSPQLERIGGDPVVYTTAGGRADGERGSSHTKLRWRNCPPSLFPESIVFLRGQLGKERAIKTKSTIKIKHASIPFTKVDFVLCYVASAFIFPHLTTRRSPFHLSPFQTRSFLTSLLCLDYSPQKDPRLFINVKN